MRILKRLFFLLILVGLIGYGLWWFYGRDAQGPVQYRTAPVAKGDLVATIGATGTVEPEEVTDVGAQVTGQIMSFGKDKAGKDIDYGSQVEKGMLLAKLDDVVYNATLTEAEAQLAQANASVTRAKADLKAAEAKLYGAKRDWERAERIGPSDALAQTTYDNYKSAYETAEANVGVAQAAIAVADATVKQQESAVERAKRNLKFTVIESPETGTVIDRRVNIGQTVTSNLSVASLFLIARDLKKMQVWVAVNEADIGQIHVDQRVTFTTDAFPGEQFHGTVGKIRLNAQMTQNVVTYTVEVNTENPNYRLLPYLTANVLFEASRRDNVLMVPNAALRWAPASEREPAEGPGGAGSGGGPGAERSGGGERGGGGGRGMGRGGPRGGGGGGGGSGGGMSATSRPSKGGGAARNWRQATVWVKDGEGAKSIDVRAGLTDGLNTEITGDQVREGMEVIVGEIQPGAGGGPAGSTNPFLPQFRRGRR
ncbi:MAG TPA: efflux RND transporter periplasmic adaptor subunit [Tepidisphaeraceae bacterium]